MSDKREAIAHRKRSIRDTDRIFRLMDEGETIDSAAGILRDHEKTGRKSEEAVINALRNTPGVSNVSRTNFTDDAVRGIDLRVRTNELLLRGDWELQIKSNNMDCERFLEKKMEQFGAESIDELKLRMARKGRMVINGGVERKDDTKNGEMVVGQFIDWINLAKVARRKRQK
jgi:hypothetical protein